MALVGLSQLLELLKELTRIRYYTIFLSFYDNLIKYGTLKSFSEQQFVDCDNLKNGGKDHGW